MLLADSIASMSDPIGIPIKDLTLTLMLTLALCERVIKLSIIAHMLNWLHLACT